MTRTRIYFDHNATSPLRPEARAAMMEALDCDGNASSVHGEGRAQRRRIEDAREQVAALVGARPADVIFTSGATEANNLALGGGWDAILVAGVEHESVLIPAEMSGAKIVTLAVDGNGVVGADVLANAVGSAAHLGQDGGRCLLTLQMANNETGVCQDVRAAAAVCRTHGVFVHSDAVQACGRVAVDVADLDVDLLSLSSHKIGGPMGVGALVVRDGFQLRPLIQGGGQERRRRAGTENVAAIAGFGAAAHAAQAQLGDEAPRLSDLRERMERALRALVPGAVIIGEGGPRLPNTVCVALSGELAETSVIKLDLSGVAVSAGSACSSGKVGASHVLGAMGIAPEVARSAIRISFGWNSTDRHLEEFSTRFRALLNPVIKAVA